MSLGLAYGALSDLEKLRRQSASLDLYRRVASVLERSSQAHSPTVHQQELGALLDELNRQNSAIPGSSPAGGPVYHLPENEAERQVLASTIQARVDGLRGLGMPPLWGAIKGRLWLLAGLCTIWTLLSLVRLSSQNRPWEKSGESSTDGGPPLANPPLSFTHMALGTVQASDKSPHSVRGYTERVLQSLSNLLVLTGPDGGIQMVNEALCSTLEYQRAELLGKPVSLILPSEDAEAQVGIKNLESTFQTSSGVAVPVLLSCSAVKDGQGKVEGLVIVAQDITERKLAERSLMASEKRLRTLMERLVSAQEDERQKVARDLHDGMLQLVIAAEMQLTTFRKKVLEETPHAGDARLQTGIECLSEAVKEGRRLINNLRPPTLDKFGLVQSLRQEVSKLAREMNCEFEFAYEIGQTIVSTAIETSVFRICQEALNNIRKHGQPKTLSVHLQVTQGNLVLTVEDDGGGFEPDSPEFRGGLGLHSMRERAELHGGSFELQARPQEGTKITAVLPLEEM